MIDKKNYIYNVFDCFFINKILIHKYMDENERKLL